MIPNRRLFLALGALGLSTLSTLTLSACSSTPARPRNAGPDAVVDAGFTGKAGSRINGRPNYRSLGEAIEAAPSMSRSWQILLKPGRYEEKLAISLSGLHLLGEDRERTIISFGAYAGQNRSDGVGTWGTNGSATLTVAAPDFTAENLSIENSFDYPDNVARDSSDPAYIRGAQAVAVYVTGAADRSTFRNVKLLGYQDTLFVDAGRVFFDKCYIAGNVDFIFGNATAWFEECEIVTRSGGRKSRPIGWVTAPSTKISRKYGLVFHRSRLGRGADVPDNSSPLGRPWHPSADPEAIGQSVFLDCWMDAHISSDGWDSMSSTTKGGAKMTFTPEDSRFFEYRSNGPGAVSSPKRRQLTEAQAADYTRDKVFGDWRP